MNSAQYFWGAIGRAKAERCSPYCVGEQGTDKNDEASELVERDVLEASAFAELEERRARADQLERTQLACDQLLARLRRRVANKVETRSASVGPDEPHHHDERVSGDMSPS